MTDQSNPHDPQVVAIPVITEDPNTFTVMPYDDLLSMLREAYNGILPGKFPKWHPATAVMIVGVYITDPIGLPAKLFTFAKITPKQARHFEKVEYNEHYPLRRQDVSDSWYGWVATALDTLHWLGRVRVGGAS